MGKAGFLRKWRIGLFIVLLILGSAGKVHAAATGSLLQIMVDDKEVVLYIECGSRIDSVDGQVAQYPCESVEIMSSGDITIHTVIMLDNSLSISEDNRENIKNILREYVEELPENETVSFAAFGEDIQFLTEKSQDAEEILGLIDEIEFHDQDTYLTDYLYQAVEGVKNDPEYTRFVVISDGVDNKAIGITKEELTSKLTEIPRPVYTIGHKYKDNSSELKNMFALSRMTGGKEFLIEDFEDMSFIVNEIHDFSDLYCIRIDIPENVMDGGNRHILLNIHTDDGNIEITGEALMPFTLAEEKTEIETTPTPMPTSVPTPTPTSEPAPTPAATPETVPAQKSDGIGIDKIVGAVILVIAGIILLFYKRKHKCGGVQSDGPDDIPDEPPVTPPMSGITTNYLLILRERSNPERIFRYPLDGHVIVGRNIDMVQIPVDYNLTVSGQHCEFYMKNNRFFIRDMNAVNHTYLEGRMIVGESEITSGSIVRLGEVEFSVEIMPM